MARNLNKASAPLAGEPETGVAGSGSVMEGPPTATLRAANQSKGKSDATPTRRRPKGLSVSHGSANLKAYPITQGELWALSGVGLAASVAFSFASGFINFFIDTSKDLELASGITKETIAFWSALKFSALAGGGIAFLIGVALIVTGAFAIKRIINRTTFNE